MRLLVLPLMRPRIEVSSAAGREVLVDVIVLLRLLTTVRRRLRRGGKLKEYLCVEPAIFTIYSYAAQLEEATHGKVSSS